MGKLLITKKELIWLGFCGLYLKGAIVDFFKVLTKLILGTELSALSSILTWICIFVLIIGVLFLLNKKYLVVGGFTLSLILLWYISGTLHPDTQSLLAKNISDFFFGTLPFAWFFGCFFCEREWDLEYYYKKLFNISVLRMVLALVSQTLILLFPWCDVYQDYMVMGYSILIPSCFVLSYVMCYMGGTTKEKILLGISFIYLLITGCRGAAFCFMALYICCIFYNIKHKGLSRQKAIKIVIISLLIIILIISIKGIARWLITIGINSRTFQSIAFGQNASDEMRILIYQRAIETIKSNKFGCGIMYDRMMFPESWKVPYVHNLILELGIDFGILGFLIFLLLVALTIHVIKKANPIIRIIIITTICSSVLRLMVSSSLWTDQMFWAMMGTLVVNCRQTKDCE